MRHTAVLTQGRISQQLIWLALPLICGNILQQLYNTVDAFVIGRFLGSDAFGAVGVAGTVMNLFIFVLSGCCAGISVLFAQFYGSGDLKSFRREGFLSLVFGLLLTVLLSLAALLPLLAATVLNVGLDILFVGPCAMGIAGAAAATVLSQGVAALLALGYLKWKLPQLLFRRADMRMDKGMLKRTAAFGVVSALHQSAVYIGKLLVQGAVNAQGSAAINGFTAATRIEGFANSFGDSGAEAISVFIAQNTGAGQKERVRQGFWKGELLLVILGLSMSLLMFVGAHAALTLMLGENDPEALREGVGYLRWISVFYILCFIGSGYVGYYRGVGRVSVPVIGSALQQTIRVILSYQLAGPMGLVGVAVSIGVGWSVIVLYQTILFRTKIRLT